MKAFPKRILEVKLRVSSQSCKILIDQEDVHLLGSRAWHIDKDGYLAQTKTITVQPNKYTVESYRLHTLILDKHKARADKLIHFRDGNKLNYCKSNLILANKAQSLQKAGVRTDNTSGYKGVSKGTRMKRWQAIIGYKGKKIRLGCFDTPEQAAEAYNKAALEYYGEFAYLNTIPQ